jgi:hypothetical protein
MSQKTVLSSITGELFQPVRLHYQVLDQAGLERALENLRCLEHDSPRRRRVWLYDHEARSLRFPKSFSEIPESLRPIVIGSFYQRQEAQLILDLRSCERAVAAIPFFDKYLPRKVAKVTHAEVVNKLFSVAGNERLTPEQLFDRGTSTSIDPAALQQSLIEQAARGRNPLEKMKILMEEMGRRSKQPLPEIERLPVHYYEEGIDSFTAVLRLRQIVAMQHWLGNTKYTMLDAIKEQTKSP